jgi:phospholipid/cholesterol/gamma-HCH transport system substrate-binding protein
MTARGREVVVGAVFFATLTVLGIFTIIIGDMSILNPPKKVWVYFGDVAGLRVGNVVRISGLERGKVKEMRLRGTGVLAMLSVHPSVKIHPGHKIRVKAFSPLGGKYVDVDRGDLSQPPLSLSEEMPKEGREAKEALIGSTEKEFISELSDLAETVKPMVISAVANIRDVTGKVNSMQGTLGRLVGDPTMYNHLRNAARNLEETTDSVNKVLGKINEGDGTLAKLVNDGKLYDSTVRTLERVESIARKVDEGKGTIGALFNDDGMRDDVKRTIQKVASLLKRADDGEGTMGQLVRNDRLYKALSQALEDLSKLSGQIADAKGPVGVLITDAQAGENVRRTIAHIEKITDSVASGRGSVGRLFMDDRLITEAERVVVELRESVEDLREQAPINAFVNAVFQAF